jgi:TonB-linked SusC/RagA family outer membrane protein
MKNKIQRLLIMCSKLVMYGTLMQIILFSTMLASPGNAQENKKILSIKEATISLQVQDYGVEQVLKAIENKTDYHFFYDRKFIDRKARLDISVMERPVSEVLLMVSEKAGLKFRQMNDVINVTRISSGEVSEDLVMDISMQTVTITGRVNSSDDIAGLPGANVVIKGTSQGTVTDMEGKYTIDVAGPETILVFSSVGYLSEEVTVGNRSVIDITLSTDITSLDEIVVVGYGTQKRVNLTGAVSSVSAEEISNQPVGQTSMALQGVAPGVTITQRSGQPGSDGGAIRIRGIGTLGNSNPLIMVDGVETGLDNIDPSEIESISILKDAASAAIYGARAANGVVLVTTKRGKEGVRVNYNSYAGFQTPTDLPNIVGALDHMMLTNEAFTNVGNSPQYSEQFLNQYRAGMPSDQYPDTDWQKLTMSNSAFMQNHNVSINAGSKRSRVFASFSYLDQDGIIPNTDFSRFNLRLNSDVDVTDRLTLSTDLFLRRTLQNQPSDGTGYVFHWMRRIPANEVGVLSNGRWGEGWNGDHPLARAQDGGLRTAESLDAILNFRMDYKFTDWLSAEVMYAPRFENPHVKTFRNITQTYARDGVTPTHFVPQRNSLTERFDREWYNNFRAMITMSKAFNKHEIGFTGGYQQEDLQNTWISAYREVFPLPQYQYIDAGNRANEMTGGSAHHWALSSFFGRVTYNYGDRYLFEANVRRDGSSRFADGNRFGVFPSFSGAWRISEEAFMSGTRHFLDQLKLRASWGQLGNQNIGLYPFAAFMTLGGSGSDYSFNGMNSPGAALNSMANSAIQWETSENTDIGIEFNLWGKLDFSFDYYYRLTRDILLTLNIPQTLGLSAPFQNAGKVENRGYDIMVNYRDKIGEVNFNVMLNMSDVRNTILGHEGHRTIPAVTVNQGRLSQ